MSARVANQEGEDVPLVVVFHRDQVRRECMEAEVADRDLFAGLHTAHREAHLPEDCLRGA